MTTEAEKVMADLLIVDGVEKVTLGEDGLLRIRWAGYPIEEEVTVEVAKDIIVTSVLRDMGVPDDAKIGDYYPE